MMHLMINTSLMVPIYEQIVDQVKVLIRRGELKENDVLPSVRSLSRELKISALTVKKAYDALEAEGYTATVHGKGTYVTAVNPSLLLEEQRKELEADLELAVQKGRRYGISKEGSREARRIHRSGHITIPCGKGSRENPYREWLHRAQGRRKVRH